MATVTFYEKPGCKGNLRQKTLLAAAGHTVRAKSLKTEAWTVDRLHQFLGKLPVARWFNPSAPTVKSGEIVPENISHEHAMQLLLENPLLIRRPLMEVDEQRMVGFDIAAVDAWIGLKNIDLPEGDIEACVHGPAGHGACGSHEHDHAHENEHAGCGTY